MTDHTSEPKNMQWYLHLQSALKQAVQQVYQDKWRYSHLADRGLACEIAEREGVFELLEVVYAEDQEELLIYAKLGPTVTTVRKAHEVVHEMMSLCDEGFFVFVPLHTPEALHFWFLTGYTSHRHAGRIIIRREDNPHLQFETASVDMQ